mgnify:CR=1 FL=1
MQWLETILPWSVTAAALILLAVQGVHNRIQVRKLEARLKQRCDDLGRELHAVSSGSMGVGRRLVECEQSLHRLSGALEEMRLNDPLRVPYDEASKLVELGADTDDLMNSCGISRPEAELVSALRKGQSPSTSGTDTVV